MNLGQILELVEAVWFLGGLSKKHLKKEEMHTIFRELKKKVKIFKIHTSTWDLTGVSFGGDGSIRSGLVPKGFGKADVEIDILLEPLASEVVDEVGLATSNFLTKSFTEEFRFFKLALAVEPRLNCSWSFLTAANSKAED